jgi:DNA polymerase/3'-5' exonuclease PolX
VPDNADLTDALERVGDLLETQDADPFRVRAWHRAAQTVRAETRPLARILAAQGRAGLLALPGIGESLASALEELLHTGRLGMLERLEGQTTHISPVADPGAATFCPVATIPSLGCCSHACLTI